MMNLNLLSYQKDLKITTEDGKRYIYDPIRKRKFVLTPEEMVRQLCIQYLIQAKNVNINRVNVEKQFMVNGLRKRFDIIVYGTHLEPFLLVECKAPSVPISQKTFDQIGQYNIALRMDYLLVTNGMHSFCCQMDYEKEAFTFLDEIPSFPA